MKNILQTLTSLKIVSKSTVEIFSTKTRDNSDCKVFRDKVSGVLYITQYDDKQTEDYKKGSYKTLDDPQIHANYKKIDDVERRIFEYKKYYVNKDICDVGCGSGLFLQSAMINAKSVSGVEIQENYLDLLNSNKITSFKSIQKHSKAFDTVFMFHTLEHISDPMSLLKSVKNSLQKSNGKVVIEVPHANDFLISSLADQQFIDFTLWSKHLVLHTRNSLRLMLEAAGFSNVIIQGVQRFPLSNTLTWLSKSKPGGHETNLSMIDSPELHNAYENCLRKIDETDTLVAVASI